MTTGAQKHLDKAAKLLAKGDGFYAQAADEIIAAQKADSTLSNREIAKRFDKSHEWVRRLVAWRTSDTSSLPTPYAGEAPAINLRKTKQMLREAPLEQVEQMIAELPKERQQAIRAAVGDPYAKARQEEDEKVKSRTPAERKEIEAAKEAISRGPREALASFATLGVVGHLEQATEDLAQMIADQALTPESIYRITQAHDRFVTELEVATAMAGLERSEA